MPPPPPLLLFLFFISLLLLLTLYNAETFLSHLGYVHVDNLEAIYESQNADKWIDSEFDSVAKKTEVPSHSPKSSNPPTSTSPQPDDEPQPSSSSNTNDKNDNDNNDTSPKRLYNFYDSHPNRPTPPFSTSPNSDLPPSSFPSLSWQSDVVYLNHYIQQNIELIDRTLKGFGSEYSDPSLFKFSKLQPSIFKSLKHESLNSPITTTSKSFNKLSKRILHSLITGDDFRISLMGHSSAAGHGNNFRQQSQNQGNKQSSLKDTLSR